MSRMGKWLLIFGILAIVSAIAFGFSVAAFGVTNGDYGISIMGIDLPVIDGLKIKIGGNSMGKAEILFRNNGTNYTYEFEKDKEYSTDFDAAGLSDVKLGLASCKADVVCSDTDRIRIVYKTGNKPVNFTAELKDGVLEINENITISLFSFGSYKNSELKVEIPSELYNSFGIDIASGSLTSDNLMCDSFDGNLASGSFDLKMHADRIKLNVASGKASVSNITDENADDIDINVASGSVELNGFGADDTKAALASGNVTLNGISGRVNGELMSGTLTLVYSEWNDDLSIKLASGKADVTLPAGSGANVEYKHLSGKTDVSLDGSSVTLTKTSHADVGGENKQRVDIETASGTVRLHN